MGKKILVRYEARPLGSDKIIEDNLIITEPCDELFGDIWRNGYDAHSSLEIKDAARAIAQLRGHIIDEVVSIKAVSDDQESLGQGLSRQWVDIEVLPVAVHSVYDSDCPIISGEVYSYTSTDDAANAVIGIDRENGYRFLLHVGIDGIDVEIRRANNRSLAGVLIKSNRRAVYYI